MPVKHGYKGWKKYAQQEYRKLTLRASHRPEIWTEIYWFATRVNNRYQRLGFDGVLNTLGVEAPPPAGPDEPLPSGSTTPRIERPRSPSLPPPPFSLEESPSATSRRSEPKSKPRPRATQLEPITRVTRSMDNKGTNKPSNAEPASKRVGNRGPQKAMGKPKQGKKEKKGKNG